MDINFELYKIFYYVAKNLSFSQASSSLFVSQSAVSQGIKALEDKMGCQLFFRSTKQVKLTKEGEVLFGHIEQAFNFIKSGERNIAEMHSMVQGEIRIGASDTICKYYLLPYLQKFHAMYPNIKIHITNRTSPKCIALLQNGSVDFSVVNLPNSPLSSGFDTYIVENIEDVFIGGRTFSYLKEQKLSIRELIHYPLLLLEKRTSTREFFEKFIGSHRLQVIPEIELGSIDLLVEMTKIGLGISFVMKSCIKQELAREEVFILPLEESVPKRNIGIVVHKNIPLPIAANTFIRLCTDGNHE